MHGNESTAPSQPSVTFAGSVGAGLNPSARQAQESAVDINSETMKMLWETAAQLDHLIYKVEGPRPQDTPSNKTSDAPPRGVLCDARVLRGIASSLLNRVQHLHELVGNV